MSRRTVISVRGLGKRYELGETFSSNTLRDAVAARARRMLKRPARGSRKEFWALKDVSFDVAEGEVLGIIGANGAGKSTLLKILSQITEPTQGEIRVRGRVASLLEVGTGFHPELSGRENVFMNGAILGMTQAEIRKKFDEIVAFAGVEEFVDTPVKRYSSGMLVRLGFAVAAHLDPEILVIDEVLAVGDEAFQKKCVSKIGETSRSGRTVLFVSHNFAAVEALCTRAMLLEQGSRTAEGLVIDVVAAYRSQRVAHNTTVNLRAHEGRAGNRRPLMRSATLLDADGEPSLSFRPGETISIAVDHHSFDRELSPVLGVVVKTADHAPVFGIDNRTVDGFRFPPTRSPGRLTCRLPELPLAPGHYLVDLYLGDSFSSLDVVRDALTLEVKSADFYGTGRLPSRQCGSILWRGEWTWTPLETGEIDDPETWSAPAAAGL